MMTGQILSGVDPLIAVRYQIVVMAMILQASGYSVALFLCLSGRAERAEWHDLPTPTPKPRTHADSS